MSNKITELVQNRLSVAQFQELADLLGSTNQRTRILNDPEKASHEQLAIFSHLLALSPTVLLNEYGLGKDGLHALEKKLYEAVVPAA